MIRRLGSWAALAAAFALIGSCGREPTGLSTRRAGLVLAPRFADLFASSVLDLGVVRVVLTKPPTEAVVIDTTIPFPAAADSMVIELSVPIEQTTETFTLRMAVTNAVGDTVFRVGPAAVVATTNPLLPPSEIPAPVYVGVGADAVGVRFVDPPVAAPFNQAVPIVAEAFDGSGVAIPGTPIGFELVTPADSLKARFPDRGVGSLQTLTTRGTVAIRAYLLTEQSVEHSITVQPVATAMQLVSGSGQVATVGAALAAPTVARVIAADDLGVLGVPVDFRLTRGTDTLATFRDTSDASGLVSFTPTLGTSSGAYSVSATATIGGGATVSAIFTATATAGPAARLEFTQQPTNVLPLVVITPAVIVTARDAFGNVATAFADPVTVALLDNPLGAVLGGTLARAAVGGVATFADLTLDGLGTGLTLRATAAAVESDTSAAFDITVGVPTRVEFVQQPTNTTSTVAFAPSIQVAIRDAGGSTVATATDVVTLEILEGPGGAVLAGPTSVAAVAGVATFPGVSIARAGLGYTLRATAVALASDTSAAFNVAVGPATQLGFYTQPPATIQANAQMNVQVAARDAGGNLVETYGGAVTIAIGNNPGGATLSGTLTWPAELGIAGFGDLALDQVGTGYTLVATASGLTPATSNPFDVTPPGNVISWTNAGGGDWNTPANWSSGTVPTATDTVWIKAPGTYTVFVNFSTTFGRVEVGGASGTQTLVLSSGVVTLADSLLIAGTGALQVAGGSLTGSGAAVASGPVTWTAGNLAGGGGSLRANGILSIAGASARALNDFTLEVGLSGTWDGSAAIASGSGAVLRVLPGAVLEGRGSGGLFYDQGGAQTVTDVLGTFTRTVGTDTLRIPGLTGDGLVTVTTGILEMRNSANFSGAISVGTGAEFYFSQGASVLTPLSEVSGPGDVTIGGSAGLTSSGTWSVGGATRIRSGSFTYEGAAGQTYDFAILGGTKGGSGTFSTISTMTWTAGNLQGGGGITRVQNGGTLVIDGAAVRTLSDHTLEIAGVGQWAAGARNISSGSGGRIRVLAGGLLDLQGGGGWFYDQGGAQSVLEVLGTVTRTVGTDTIRVPGLSVATGGSVTAFTGVLEARNQGTSGGDLAAAPGGELLFTSGTQTILGSSVVSGGGLVTIGPGATVSSAGTWNVTGTTRISGGILDYDNPGGTTASLELVSGTKAGAGLLEVTAAFTWTGGSFSGGGGATRVNNGTISGATARTLNAHVLEISGTVNWSGAPAVSSGSGGGIRVLPGGTLDIQGDAGWFYDQGGAQSFLEVEGTLTRSTSSGVAIVPGLAVASTGTVSVQSGVLEARNAGTSDGQFTAAPGSELRFANGVQTMTVSADVAGGGLVHVSTGGTVTSLGTWSVTGTTRVSGGTFDFDGTGTTAVFELVGGVKGGAGLFGVSGAMTWSGGNLQGGDGITRLESGGTLAIQNPASRTLNAHTLEIGGTGVWNGSTALSSGSGGRIRVLPTGSLDIQADPQWFYDQGGAQSTFEVQGTLTRSVSSGTAFVPGLSVSGALVVSSGVLEARNVGTSSGAFTATAPGEIRFGSGTHTLTPSSTVDGSGIVNFLSGGTTVEGGWTVSGTTRLSGGSFDYNGASGTTAVMELLSGVKGGTGVFVVNTSMTWSGGNISGDNGTTRVAAAASLTISGGLGRVLNSHTLEILGTASWDNAFTLSSGSSAYLRVGPGGVLNIAAAPTFAYDQGGTPTILENLGTINVQGPGTTIVTAQFLDAGATTVAAGAALDLRGGGNLGGTSMSLATGGVLRFATGTYSMQPTLNVTGDGLALLDGATLTGLTLGDTARFARLQVNAGQLGTDPDGVVQATFLDWSGSSSLNGGGETLIPVGGTAVLTGTAGRTLNDHTLAIAGSVAWIGNFNLSSGSSASIRVRDGGALTIQPPASTSAAYQYDQGGTASTFVVEPLGTVLLSADATFTLTAQLQHSGTTSQLLGNYNVNGGGILGGDVFTDGPATMVFGGGTFTLADAFQQAGLGQVVLAAGTLTTALAADTAELGRLRFDGGTLDPNGTIVVADHFEWTGNATIAGGTVVAADTALLTGTVGRTLSAATLELQGVTRWLSDFNINSGSVARLVSTETGDFEWADGDYLSNQGGGQSILENRGALRFVGTGTTQTSAYFVDTTSNAISIPNGAVVNVSSGGRIGGSITNNAGVLQFGGGVMSLKGGASLGGPGVVRVTAGTVTADTATLGAIAIANLELQGGEMDHEGEVQVTATMTWTGGALNSNSTGTGGLTRIVSPATATIGGALVKSLAAHTLAIDAGAGLTYSGSGNLQTGSVARIVNAGVWDFNSNGSVVNALGGGTSVFENAATGIVYTTAAATGIMDLPIDNLGQLVVLGDTLRLDGGSSGNFATSATVNAAAIRLGGGSFTMTGAVNVGGTAGALVVWTGATVTVGANTLSTTGDLTTAIGGLLVSADPASLVTVGGDATFTGGTSVLSNGLLQVNGDFLQGGGNGNSFSASGNHVTRFNGTARQTVTFSNPGAGPGAGRFAELHLGTVLSSRRLELLTPVFAALVRDDLAAQPDSLISSATALLTSVTANLTNTTFAGARLSLTGAGGGHTLNTIRFDLMDPSLTQFAIDLNAGVSQVFDNATFATTPTTGYYVTVRQMTEGTSAALSLPAPVSPGSPGSFFQRLLNGGVTTLPTLLWAGVPQT